MTIAENKQDNVVLLPQSVHFYEQQLVEMLQADRFRDAAQLLIRLLRMPQIAASKRLEWERLLDGLSTMFPDMLSHGEQDDAAANLDADTEESRLRESMIARKLHDDPAYGQRLLDRLNAPEGEAEMADVMLMLEQLAFAELPEVVPAIEAWLTRRPRHPLIQFRALQTLRRLGRQGSLALLRAGGEEASIQASIDEVPLDDGEAPDRFVALFRIVRERCESRYPALVPFLPEIEADFLACAYGTPVYEEITNLENTRKQAMWAAAIHAGLQCNIFRVGDMEEIRSEYDVSRDDLDEWGRIYRNAEQLFSAMFAGQG